MARPHILNITQTPPDDFPFFFFDSNVWIAILNQVRDVTTRSYLDFWETLIQVHNRKGNPLLEKKTKNFPKVVLPAITLTETINALIRISFDTYQNLVPSPIPQGVKPNFKKHYRPTNDYKKELTRILADFQAMEDYIVLQDDKFSERSIFSEFFQYDADFDFNDYFYFRLFKGTGIPIVTNDLDFAGFEDIIILTSNPKLLNYR